MNKQQPLFLILLILGFGIAIAAAIWVFGTKNLETQRMGILSDLGLIASDAYLYRMKPGTLGGGGGSYEGYSIPAKMKLTGFGIYEVSETSSGDTLILRALAAQRLGTVQARVEPSGFLKVLVYTGVLLE